MSRISHMAAVVLILGSGVSLAQDVMTVEARIEEMISIEPKGMQLPRAYVFNSAGDLVLAGESGEDPRALIEALKRTEPQEPEISKKLVEILDRGDAEWRSDDGVIVTVEPASILGNCSPCKAYSKKLEEAAKETNAEFRWVRLSIGK